MQRRLGLPGRGRTPLDALEPDVRLFVIGRTAYLEGRVSCYERKRSLARIATQLPSVGRVVNRLRVMPGARRPNRSVEEAVLAALKIDPVLPLESITVQVTDGVVELTGSVPDISARIAAEAAAWSAAGVCHVDNRLGIGPGPPRRPASLGQPPTASAPEWRRTSGAAG